MGSVTWGWNWNLSDHYWCMIGFLNTKDVLVGWLVYSRGTTDYHNRTRRYSEAMSYF